MTKAIAIVEERDAQWDVREDYKIIGRSKEFRGTVVEANDMRMSGLPVLLRSVYLSKKHNTDLIGAYTLLRDASLTTPYIASVYRLVLHKRNEGPQLIVASEPPNYGTVAKLLNIWMSGSPSAPPPLNDSQVVNAALCLLEALERLEAIGFAFRAVHPKTIGVNNDRSWRNLIPNFQELPVPGTDTGERDLAYVPASLRAIAPEVWSSEQRIQADVYSLGMLMYAMRVWDVWPGADQSTGMSNEALGELNRFHVEAGLRDVLVDFLGHPGEEPKVKTFEEARTRLEEASELGNKPLNLPHMPSRLSNYLNLGKESRMILEDRDLWDRAAENTQDAVVKEIAKEELGEEYKWLRTDRFEVGSLSTRIAIFEHVASGIEMCLIPGGMFVRGLHDSDRERSFLTKHHFDQLNEVIRDETPSREMLIQPILMSRFPVLEHQWEKLKTGKDKAASTMPKIDVSYDQIIKVLGNTTGYLRLPSENEWEYAARAGTQTRFFWGSEMDDRYCWHAKNSKGVVQSVDAHEKRSNSFGLVDILGNILEWCEDDYQPRYEEGSTDNRPKTLKVPDSEQRKVVRGGCVWYGPAYCRASARYAIRAPQQKKKSDPKPPSFSALGFRVARSLY